jgi:hypothetical protein
MADPNDPGGPLWWLQRMETKLRQRTYRTQIYESYYQGDHRLAFATPKFREAFGPLFNELADNWCAPVVDTLNSRLHVTGFRIGDAPKGDDDAWTTWQVNKMDLQSQLGQLDSFIREEAAAIVWPADASDKSTDGLPKITVERPDQVWIEYADSSRTTRAAALKVWTEDDGSEYATVYLPDFIYKYTSGKMPIETVLEAWRDLTTDRPQGGAGANTGMLWTPDLFWRASSDWQPRQVGNERWPLPNPLGVVPVVPLSNRPRLGQNSESELRRVVPLQDAINKLIADMIVTSEYQSFRQRVFIGWDIPKNEDGTPIAATIAQAVSRILTTENPAAKVEELGEVNLAGYISAIEMLIQHLASQTSMPAHYLIKQNGNPPSGESIKSSEAPLVAKARTKMLPFGEAYEEIIRLCFAIQNDPRAKEFASETIWASPETMSESEHIDATIKKLALGVPVKQLQEDAGYSPAQIARFSEMLQEQAKEDAALAKLVATLTPPPPPGANLGPNGVPSNGGQQGAPGQIKASPETVPGAPVQPEITAARNPI